MGEAAQDQKVLQVSRAEMGRADTLRYNVNCFVIEENYDRAIEELENYKNIDFDLPGYQKKIEPYLNHCIDLVHAIRAKRGFSKNITLTRSKQQEIGDTIKMHYDELQYIFKKIEQVRNQMTLEDLRSTVWIIKAIVYSVSSIVLILFIKEMFNGSIESFFIVLEAVTEDSINWIFKLIE
jgi:hypothetical protein